MKRKQRTCKAAALLAPLFGVLLFGGMVTLRLMPEATVNAGPLDNSPFQSRNPIDKFTQQAWKDAGIQPSALCTDEEFLRRVYLDVCGLIPTGDTVRQFLDDRSTNKRAHAIDVLLGSRRYAEHWATMWCDMLREQTNAKNGRGTLRGSYRDWLENALNTNMPYDQFAKALLTATGNATENGAVNFYLRDTKGNNIDSVETVNTVSGVFMGTRMACAQCHDHPFDKWVQTDFHSLMSFFTRTRAVVNDAETVLRIDENERNIPKELKEILDPYIAKAKEMQNSAERKQVLAASLAAPTSKKDQEEMMGAMSDGMMAMGKKSANFRREIQTKIPKEDQQRAIRILQQNEIRDVMEMPVGEYYMPSEGDSLDKRKGKGELVKPVFPWDPSKDAPAVGSRRMALAEQMTGSRQFAAVQVNRLWAELFGRGIVSPIDDFRPKNPPSHPDLLDYLTDEFIKSKFDNKHVLRLILNSSTYQLSSAPNSSNRSDALLFSHQRLRRLGAEELFDSILVATGRAQGLEDALEFGAGARGRLGRDAKGKAPQWAADIPAPAASGTFLNTFNQPDRDQSVFVRSDEGSITQALEMMNGSGTSGAVKGSPLIADLLREKTPGRQAIEEMYLWALTRRPSASETSKALRFVGETPTRDSLEDLQWALLNAREFMFIK
jgi:hypothetical protein